MDDTDFDVYRIGFDIVIPQTCVVSELYHVPRVPKCIAVRVAVDNRPQELRILSRSNLGDKVHAVQYSSIFYQISLTPINHTLKQNHTRKYRSRICTLALRP